MATTCEPRPQSRLPPSPPPSPPHPRRRHKKRHSDPFFVLAESPLSSSPRSLSPARESDAPQDPLFTRIILTPLYFVSFLISLFLVNRQDRARRTRSTSQNSLLAYLWPTSWLDPEPYQDPQDSTWDRHDSAHVQPNEAIAPRGKERAETEGKGAKKRSSWYLHKKIRQVAKLEISDAFEMRGRVMVVMAGVMVLGVAGLCFGLGWLVRSLWR